MTIKDENELARYMGTALASYANKVQNGQTKPYRKFLEGETSVTITVRLAEPGGIIVEGEKEVIPEAIKKPTPKEEPTESVALHYASTDFGPEDVTKTTVKKVKPRRIKRRTD